MSYEIKADHSKVYLLPPSVEDWVPQNHEARFIREFVGALDLKALGFHRRRPQNSGAPNYSAELLLSAWFYGYFHRIRSSRQLERACRTDLPLVWLLGGNYPDHNTLWRFWKNYRKVLRGLFKQSVLTAEKLNLIDMVLHAVDGTKIQSECSRKTMWTHQKLSNKLEKIDASIAEMESSLKAENREEPSCCSLPKELEDKKVLRQEILQAMEELELAGKTKMHPKEPDAVIVKNDRRLDLGYNAQVVVDSTKQIIVAEGLCTDQSDDQQLCPMIDKVKENLDKLAGETLADGGYDTKEQLLEASEKQYDVLVREQQEHMTLEDPYHSSHFHYDEQAQTLTCPQNQQLNYLYNKQEKGQPTNIRVFRCFNTECPFRVACCKSKMNDRLGKTVFVSPETVAIQAQNKKRRSQDGRETLKRRMGIVEPVFAHIKVHGGFRRFTFRGLEKAGPQWTFVCTVHNLKKIYKEWKKIG